MWQMLRTSELWTSRPITQPSILTAVILYLVNQSVFRRLVELSLLQLYQEQV